jgi:septal ring-binding cell division protein DamX
MITIPKTILLQSINSDRVHTIQIAAVISAKQAEKLIRKLKKKGVEELYVVKAVRRSGGHWYKIRAGKFSLKNQARTYANQLVASDSIKNYFLISLPKS